ncbi:hypothetical protein V7S43_008126 [Phytophthora oleae]|uniref:Uncharacterized protein n=1 Tax=Phytophthora oleae TaxID=2107226 RepID=A0ABD3FMU1_9STRA
MPQLKLPKSKVRLPEEPDSKMKRAPLSKPEKEVVFVRLRRNERAKQVVLSSAEKYSYAKSMLEPRLQHLSELSSANYYQELRARKETVDIGLNGGNAGSSGSRDDDRDECIETEVDMSSVVDPAEVLDTVDLMEARENNECVTDGSSDEMEIPPTQPARASQINSNDVF